MPQHWRNTYLHNPKRKQLDDPNPILSSGWTTSTGCWRSKEGQEKSSKVHDLEWYPIQKRLLHALPKVRQRGGSQKYSEGDPWRDLWRSCKLEVLDQQGYPNELLLAYPAKRCKRVRQEMQQMLEVWKRSAHTFWETNDNSLPVAVCSMRTWHHWPITPR